ncbi:MIPT3 protein, partial [Formicarius rufipectus]|nr:MIPT3 protein [Formicarius rufipectus]
QVIRVTGFLRGLYTDFELKSDNVKDKDSKISFLQKAIDAVAMVTGEPLAVRPARVVAGHEPERTNELLQAIGRCCLNKLSSDAAVKRVLAGERADPKGKPPSSKARDKESREARPEEPTGHREKESRRDAGTKERSSSRDNRAKESRDKEGEKQKESKERSKEHNKEREALRDGEKQERERSKNRTAKQGRDTEKNRGKGDGKEEEVEKEKGHERERKAEGGREKDRGKGRDKEKGRTREGEAGKEQDRARLVEKEEEHHQDHSKEKAESKVRVKGATGAVVATGTFHGGHRSPPCQQQVFSSGWTLQQDTKAELFCCIVACGTPFSHSHSCSFSCSHSHSRSHPHPRSRPRSRPCSHPHSHPHSHSCCRRIPRPGSARPAPPRVKRQESTELPLPERSGSAKAIPNVILEQPLPGKQEEEEEEQFVVEAVEPLPPMRMKAHQNLPCVALKTLGVKTSLLGSNILLFLPGGLVQRILETKKDYEATQRSIQSTDREKPVALGASRTRERDLVAKEIEKSQVSIQSLCQNALALGRIVDYIQEDMDSMRNELEMWRQEKRQHEEALRTEQSAADSALEPLRAELAELEQLMKEQQEKIRAVKANILRNDEKIQRMVLSINLAARK